MAFSPDGTLLAAGGADQTVNFWNVQEPSRPRLLPGHLYQTNSFLAVAFSPDGRTLVAGDADGSACPYDVRSRRILSTDRCLAGPIAGSIDVVAFDPAGQLLFSGGRQEPVIAWSRPLWSTERSAATLADLRANVCAITGRNLTTNEWNEIFTGTELAGHPRRTCSK
jgi:WD40 repeat protein